MPDSWFIDFYSVISLYSLRSSGCQNSTYLKPCSLKFEVLRLIKSSNGEICAWALKSSHLLSQALAASISASEIKLILSSWRPFLGHFDIKTVWKWNQNHLRTLWNMAWDDLKMVLEVKSQESQKEAKAKAMECNGICHSRCKDVILAWKIKQVFFHWIIKNIAYFRYEAVDCRGSVRKTT